MTMPAERKGSPARKSVARPPASKEKKGKKAPSAPTQSDIANRAYELFLQRGGGHGSDWDDWLRAERELGPPRR